jgi:hypothetical protein
MPRGRQRRRANNPGRRWVSARRHPSPRLAVRSARRALRRPRSPVEPGPTPSRLPAPLPARRRPVPIRTPRRAVRSRCRAAGCAPPSADR